jgi:glutamate transport system substrate-binding protein
MSVRRLVGLAAAASLALALTACGGGEDAATTVKKEAKFKAGTTMAKLADKGSITIGTKFDQPLFGLKGPSGQPEGFDVEIGKIVAAKLGIADDKIKWLETVSANREPFLRDGKVDVVVATYTINDERKKVVNFGGPYYVAGQDLLVPTASTITGPEALAGKKVCSVSGSTPAKRIQTDYKDAQLQQFDSYSKCVTALAGGQVDAVTTDDIILAGYAAQPQYAGKFKVVGKKFSEEPYGIGLKKDDVAGCTKINEILKASAADGSYKAAWDSTLGKSGKAAPELDVATLTNCPAA